MACGWSISCTCWGVGQARYAPLWMERNTLCSRGLGFELGAVVSHERIHLARIATFVSMFGEDCMLGEGAQAIGEGTGETALQRRSHSMQDINSAALEGYSLQ